MTFDVDANGSGQQASQWLAQRLRAQGISTRRVLLPDGHDPNSFFVEGGDARQFQSLLETAEPEVPRDLSARLAEGILVRSPGAIGIIGSTSGDFAGLPAPTSLASGVYLETDPLFQKALNTYTSPLLQDFIGLAAAPDGSVVLGASTSIIPTATGLQIGNRNIVLITKLPPPTAAPPPPVLSLAAAASANSVAAGSDFTYSFTVKNAGPGDAVARAPRWQHAICSDIAETDRWIIRDSPQRGTFKTYETSLHTDW